MTLKDRLKGLIRRHGTPLFLIDISRLVREVERFKTLLPRVRPFYALKANSHQAVLKCLKDLGLGFDVASAREMDCLLRQGVKPSEFIFANTVKSPEALKFAKSNGISVMTFDSEYELAKIARFSPGAGVLVRIKVPNVGSVVELSLKFGCEPADAFSLLVRAHQLGLVPRGISFHVGSQCLRVENYIEALETASIIFRDARLKQLPIDTLDIGGGFPIRHLDTDRDDFSRMAPIIDKELERLFDPSVNIIAEPGRALVGPACTLIMRVIGKSIRANKHWYYLDDGIYGSLSGIIYDHCKYEYKVFRRGAVQMSTLAGPTCDSLDIISSSEQLPELELGDLVYVENIGAYSIATATQFNSLPLAKAIAI